MQSLRENLKNEVDSTFDDATTTIEWIRKLVKDGADADDIDNALVDLERMLT